MLFFRIDENSFASSLFVFLRWTAIKSGNICSPSATIITIWILVGSSHAKFTCLLTLNFASIFFFFFAYIMENDAAENHGSLAKSRIYWKADQIFVCFSFLSLFQYSRNIVPFTTIHHLFRSTHQTLSNFYCPFKPIWIHLYLFLFLYLSFSFVLVHSRISVINRYFPWIEFIAEWWTTEQMPNRRK